MSEEVSSATGQVTEPTSESARPGCVRHSGEGWQGQRLERGAAAAGRRPHLEHPPPQPGRTWAPL